MNNQQKQAVDALRKKMNEAGVTESEFNEFIEGNNSKRNTTKEQASKAYIKGKLRDSQEYLGCEERRRMKLIQSDMYKVQKAFEDGWDAAMEELWKKAIPWLKENVHKRVINDTPKFGDFRALIGDRVWEDFKKAMEE